MSPLLPHPASVLDKYRGESFLPLCTTTVTATAGETPPGEAPWVAPADDILLLQRRLSTLSGGNAPGTDPERRLAAAYAVSFHGALTVVARRERVAIVGASVVVAVSFGRDPVDGLYLLTSDVRIHLPGVDRAVAQALVRLTERVCPYAKMARLGMASTITVAGVEGSCT